MARERNRDESASANQEAFPGSRTHTSVRVFPALTPGAPQPAPQARGACAFVVPLLVVAVLIAVFVTSTPVRIAVPVVCLVASLVLLWRRPPQQTPDASLRRGVSFERETLRFHPDVGPPCVAVSLREPFGMTLVTSPKRDRMVAVWSSSAGLFYVGTTFDTSSRRPFAPLLSLAFTSLGDDAALQAIGPDGAPLELSPVDFAALVFAVEELDPACFERIVASDARGAPLTLDGHELVVGERRFDLDAPLEWRPFVFQEAFGQAVAVYQGTSIRQGASEAVLVALLPSILPFDEGEEGEIDRGMIRDLRLMQADPEEPPPREKRVAMDRLFVLPMRSALDRGRSASHAPSTRARA